MGREVRDGRAGRSRVHIPDRGLDPPISPVTSHVHHVTLRVLCIPTLISEPARPWQLQSPVPPTDATLLTSPTLAPSPSPSPSLCPTHYIGRPIEGAYSRRRPTFRRALSNQGPPPGRSRTPEPTMSEEQPRVRPPHFGTHGHISMIADDIPSPGSHRFCLGFQVLCSPSQRRQLLKRDSHPPPLNLPSPTTDPPSSQRATVQINADGLTVTVEDNRVLIGEPYPTDLCLIARFGNRIVRIRSPLHPRAGGRTISCPEPSLPRPSRSSRTAFSRCLSTHSQSGDARSPAATRPPARLLRIHA